MQESQHIDLYLLQIQIPKHQCKNKVNNRKDNMIPPEPTDGENKTVSIHIPALQMVLEGKHQVKKVSYNCKYPGSK